MYRKFGKSIKGNENEQVEQFSHNNVRIETSASLTILSVYVIVLITASIIFMGFVHLALLEAFIVATFCSCFVCGWILLLSFTARHVSYTRKCMQVDTHERDQARLGSDVIYATDQYILYRDPMGDYRFQGTVTVQENRHFPAQLESPKAPDAKEMILTMWDDGSPGREIERWINKGRTKDEKISYHQITKTLNTYRPGWQERSKKVVDSEDYPVDE